MMAYCKGKEDEHFETEEKSGFMSLIMTASTVATVNADSNSFMTGYSGQYGEPFAEVSRGLYTYKLHENEKKGTVIYTGEFLTHAIWHQYGQAIITYLRLRDEGFSFDSAKSWNDVIRKSIIGLPTI